MKGTQKRYILLNKPYGLLSQFTSEGGHPALDTIGLPPEVYAAGRLDRDSEGLLLLTNDGPFIKRFLDRHIRRYWVQVEGEITPEALGKLRKGVRIKSGMTSPCQCRKLELGEDEIWERQPPIRQRKNIPTSWIEIELTEGKNRQVRRMSAAVGFPTLRLIRVGLGSWDLIEQGPEVGQWIEVSKEEIVGRDRS